MHGLLVVDKPAGPTSHDVVERIRRVLRTREVGHTGTLDPTATGVLPLVLGKATRLARFLSASDKSYEAVMTLGVATDTGDAAGVPIGSRTRELPPRDAIETALDEFRGTFMQQPPVYSAKKIAGRRSYKLARVLALRQAQGERAPDSRVVSLSNHERSRGRLPEPVEVTVYAIELLNIEADRVALRVDCSAGFYVRSLAHDLGERLGVGAHLSELRRTRSGGCTLDDAIALEQVERQPDLARRRLIPPRRMLAGLPGVVLTADGVRRAVHGVDVGPPDIVDPAAPAIGVGAVRLLDGSGDLVAIATPGKRLGLLHPSVVLM